MRRLFVAVDLSIAVVERLASLQRELELRIDEAFDAEVGLRAVEATNMHVTLKFLGDTPPQLVSRVGDVLRELSKPLFPFEVTCCNVGAFPDAEAPRILWAGFDEQGAEVLELLQAHVEKGLSDLGIEEESRPYRPHVTVSRVKSRRAPSFEALLERYRTAEFGESFIKDIVLYESHLDPDGPRYEVVERFALGG